MAHFIDNTEYERLPCKHQLDNYVKTGHPVGGFLTALLENNLKNTFARADESNLPFIHSYVLYLYNWCPRECWGSPEAVKTWYAKFQEPH